MMKKTLKLASLTFLMFGCAVASEFRPPLSADKGPQRLDMQAERGAEGTWELDLYSVGYSRDAHKAFTKHGGKTAPLTSLIFGKDSLKVPDALPGDLASAYSEKFNANLGATTLYPRVSYSERGINLGGKLGYRVWDGKGLLGLKLNVPFKTIRMERDNNAETVEQGNQTNYIFGDLRSGITIPITSAAGDSNLAVDTRSIPANMYRLSFVNALPFLRDGEIVPFLGKTSRAADTLSIGGQAYNLATANADTDRGGANVKARFGGIPYDTDIPYVIFRNKATNKAPSVDARAIKMANQIVPGTNNVAGAAAGAVAISTVDRAVFGALADASRVPLGINNVILASNVSAATRVNPANRMFRMQAAGRSADANEADIANHVALGDLKIRPLQELPTDINRIDEGVLYVVPTTDAAARPNYENLFKQYGDELWLMTVAQNDGINKLNAGQDQALKDLINRYGSESAEQWLWRNGYAFATNQRTGLGDITVTPCYDHVFSREWQGGVYAHVLIPTGGSRKMGENPYKARLGNDNHVELGGGANVAWQAFDWMNLRLDAMAAYALPAKEKVAAPFKGATVKALGPVVEADIDYARVKASLDTTIVHPKASALATTIGYDFEYKSKDNVSLKDKKYTFKTLANDAASWFGGFYDNAAPAGFKDRAVDLDNAVLAKDTERISHNLRVESSWHATDKLSLFWGASAPLWGQYVAKMNSFYGGINVKY